MKFNVIFNSRDLGAVSIETSCIGTNGMDQIRWETGVFDLSIDRISHRCKGIFKYIYLIEINEEEARETGLCKETNEVFVLVPNWWLNEFCYKKTSCEKNEETGEITSAWLEWSLDENAVWERWKELGFPTQIEETSSTDED